MALPPLPKVVRTAFIHELHAQEVVNVVNWEFLAEPTLSQIEELAEAAATQWITWPMGGLSLDLKFLRVEARQAVPGSGLAADYDVDPPEVGGNLGACDNNQTATVASLRTGRAGRSFRGRLFIGGIPNSVPDNGLLPISWRTDMAAGLLATLIAIRNSVGCNPVIVSYFSNKVQRVTPVVTEVVNVLCVT